MGAIYVPDMLVLSENSPGGHFWCSAVAASLRGGSTLVEKTEGILRVAISEKHTTLVLGAWGCGAFGNDATEVAAAWDKAMTKYGYAFERIIYAIPGKDNYKKFAKHLGTKKMKSAVR